MPVRISILLLFFSFLSREAKPQEVVDNDVHQKRGEFNIALTGGLGVLGPKGAMEDQMENSGLGDTRPEGWFSDEPTDYPRTFRIPIASLEATYFFREKSGVTLSVGIVDNIEVEGYDNIGISNTLALKSEIWAASLSYTLRSKDKKHHLNVGPALFLHTVRDNALYPTPQKNENMKPGLTAGYSTHIIHKEDWFLAFNLNGRWATESEIGPFVIEHELGSGLPEQETFRSEFRGTKVRLTGLSLGVGLGFRMGNKNN